MFICGKSRICGLAARQIVPQLRSTLFKAHKRHMERDERQLLLLEKFETWSTKEQSLSLTLSSFYLSFALCKWANISCYRLNKCIISVRHCRMSQHVPAIPQRGKKLNSQEFSQYGISLIDPNAKHIAYWLPVSVSVSVTLLQFHQFQRSQSPLYWLTIYHK